MGPEFSSSQTNVMMTEDGIPRITDVGLNALLVKTISGDRRKVPAGWMFKAPEELWINCNPSSFMPTTEMDVYAFATTAYTVSLIYSYPYHSDPDELLTGRYSP
jgi:hypothetical protein